MNAIAVNAVPGDGAPSVSDQYEVPRLGIGRTVFFYPHSKLRDRQLDTIRCWPRQEVLNREALETMSGAQVARTFSLRAKVAASWKQRLPLINLKRRPASIPSGAVLYVWGGIPITGPFILELDNPYALTGYNFRAFDLYRPVLKMLLLNERCLEIRCLSRACMDNLSAVLGSRVRRKSRVYYPVVRARVDGPRPASEQCRFLFVGTQFEIKAGPALLRAFRRVHSESPHATLDVITHLPQEYASEVKSCPGIRLHEPEFSREDIVTRFMLNSDVLIHPSYMESFGMVILEALSCGLPVIVADVYATKEMVVEGANGYLVTPPVSAWTGVLPSPQLYDWTNFKRHVRDTDTSQFEQALVDRMLLMIRDPAFRTEAGARSLALLKSRFDYAGDPLESDES